MADERPRWQSEVPDLDDFGNPIHDVFIDGATRGGPWAIMVPSAHEKAGRGLGLGRGQRYELDRASGYWLKTGG